MARFARDSVAVLTCLALYLDISLDRLVGWQRGKHVREVIDQAERSYQDLLHKEEVS